MGSLLLETYRYLDFGFSAENRDVSWEANGASFSQEKEAKGAIFDCPT